MCIENSDCNCGCGDRTWFPLNSKIQVQKDGSIFIQAPVGWAYVGFESKTGKLKVATSGGTTVSCTCTGTGSCLPFVATGPAGSTAGCAGNCTSCSQKQSAKIGTGPDTIFSTGGYIDLAANIDYASTPNLPAAFAAMFEVKEIKQAFKSFLDKVYGGLPWPKMIEGENFITAPEGYSIVPVNIYGRAAMVPVPTIALRTIQSTGGTTASCKCTQGTCTVKSQSIPFVGSATWCEGSCSGTCTLSNAMVVGNGVVNELYKSNSYTH